MAVNNLNLSDRKFNKSLLYEKCIKSLNLNIREIMLGVYRNNGKEAILIDYNNFNEEFFNNKNKELKTGEVKAITCALVSSSDIYIRYSVLEKEVGKSNYKWTNFVEEGEVAGTLDTSSQVYGVNFKLYDKNQKEITAPKIRYRVQDNTGEWTDFCFCGQAGAISKNPLLNIQVDFVDKISNLSINENCINFLNGTMPFGKLKCLSDEEVKQIFIQLSLNNDLKKIIDRFMLTRIIYIGSRISDTIIYKNFIERISREINTF